MAVPDLRPMGIGDILDVTFRLYRRRFLTFLLIALVVYIPYALFYGPGGAAATGAPSVQNPAGHLVVLLGLTSLFLRADAAVERPLVDNISASYPERTSRQGNPIPELPAGSCRCWAPRFSPAR